jgi:hypothetical protein
MSQSGLGFSLCIPVLVYPYSASSGLAYVSIFLQSSCQTDLQVGYPKGGAQQFRNSLVPVTSENNTILSWLTTWVELIATPQLHLIELK